MTFFLVLNDCADSTFEIQRRREECIELHLTCLAARKPLTFLNESSMVTRANTKCESWRWFIIAVFQWSIVTSSKFTDKYVRMV